jgi:hypothetical protein
MSGRWGAERELAEPLFSAWLTLLVGRRSLGDFPGIARAVTTASVAGVDLEGIFRSAVTKLRRPGLALLWDFVGPRRPAIIHEMVAGTVEDSTKSCRRRIAAADGFIYIFDSRFGLARYGSGFGGTLYLSQSGENLKRKGEIPVSLAICGGFVVLRTVKSPELILFRGR